jgi:hypothetical protein
MEWILAILVMGMSVVDYLHSKPILKMSIELEESYTVKWLVKQFGLTRGLILGTIVPTTFIAIALAEFNLRTLLGIYLGMHIMLSIKSFYRYLFFKH